MAKEQTSRVSFEPSNGSTTDLEDSSDERGARDTELVGSGDPAAVGQAGPTVAGDGSKIQLVGDDGSTVVVEVSHDGTVIRTSTSTDPATGATTVATRDSSGFQTTTVTYPDGSTDSATQWPDGSSERQQAQPQPDGSLRTTSMATDGSHSVEVRSTDADGVERRSTHYDDGRPDEVATRRIEARPDGTTLETVEELGVRTWTTTRPDGVVEVVSSNGDGSLWTSETRTPLPNGERVETRSSEGTTTDVVENVAVAPGLHRQEHRVLDAAGNVVSREVADIRVTVNPDLSQTTEITDANGRMVQTEWPDGRVSSRSEYEDGTFDEYDRSPMVDGTVTSRTVGRDGGTTEVVQQVTPGGDVQTTISRADGVVIDQLLAADGSVIATTTHPDGSQQEVVWGADGAGTVVATAPDGTTDQTDLFPDRDFGPQPVPPGPAPAPTDRITDPFDHLDRHPDGSPVMVPEQALESDGSPAPLPLRPDGAAVDGTDDGMVPDGVGQAADGAARLVKGLTPGGVLDPIGVLYPEPALEAAWEAGEAIADGGLDIDLSSGGALPYGEDDGWGTGSTADPAGPAAHDDAVAYVDPDRDVDGAMPAAPTTPAPPPPGPPGPDEEPVVYQEAGDAPSPSDPPAPTDEPGPDLDPAPIQAAGPVDYDDPVAYVDPVREDRADAVGAVETPPPAAPPVSPEASAPAEEPVVVSDESTSYQAPLPPEEPAPEEASISYDDSVSYETGVDEEVVEDVSVVEE